MASKAQLATAGATDVIGTTAAAVHATEKPSAGHAPTSRSISDAPSPAQQSHSAQNSTVYPPVHPEYQNDTTRDISGNDSDYTGLVEGALGGTALGVGGDMAYEEYEEYQSGDEVLEEGSEAGDVADIEEAGEPEDEVFEDYNPEEDEVVEDYNPDEDEVVEDNNPEEDEVIEHDAVGDAEVEAGNESDGVVEEYDPEQDEVIEDGGSEPADPVEADAEPAVEYAQSDPGQPEEPGHEVAGDQDVDSSQDISDDDQNVGDDDY